MARALESDDRYVTTVYSEPGVGLGRVGLDSLGSSATVRWNDDRTRCLVMEGELYDLAAFREALADDVPGPEPGDAADLLLRLYDRFGTAIVPKLNGAFVAAVWDRPTRQLVVFNDRLGLFPLYYARIGGDLLFASGVRALLSDSGLSRTVDVVALNQFLVFDHMLDDRTLLSAVRLLPQGSILTFRAGRLCMRRYWTPQYPDVYEAQPVGTIVEQFTHYLRQAVARQAPDGRPAGVLLSGGLDSRLLLGSLVEHSRALHTLTFGIPGCDDASVAEEVAAVVGTRHHFLELKPTWLMESAREAVRATDGLANVVNLHVLATGEAQSQYARILYKGFMGDAILGFALKPEMWATYERDAAYTVHLGVHASQGVINYDQAEQRKLLTDACRAQVGDGVLQAYRDGMDKAGVSQLASQRLYFDLTQRVPRMTLNGVEAARTRAIVRLPFCDNDFVDFAMAVPPGFLFERSLPRAALIAHFPRLARIPLASTGRPLISCARDLSIQARTLLSWHLRRVGVRRLGIRERRPYKDYDGWFRTTLRSWVAETLLHPRALERGYFRPAYVRQLVDEHVAGANHAVRLGAMLTLELWHRQFID